MGKLRATNKLPDGRDHLTTNDDPARTEPVRWTARTNTAATTVAALLAGLALGAVFASAPAILIVAALLPVAALAAMAYRLVARPVQSLLSDVARARREGLIAPAAAGAGLEAIEDAFHELTATVAKGSHEKLLLKIMSENATDVIVLGDANRNRTYVSPSCRDVLGYEPGEMLGAHAFDLVHPDDSEAVRLIFADLGPDAPQAAAVFQMRRKDGSYVWIEGRYRHLDADGGVLAILRDIGERKRSEQLLVEAHQKLAATNAILARLSQQDGLTGLTNRRHFDELLEHEVARAARNETPLGMVLLDVDCFKAFNDRYGHLAGDTCLKQISAAVQIALRRPGDLAARYGGEEFVVLLPETDHAGALAVAENIRAAVLDLNILHEDSPFGAITISAGAGAAIPSATPLTPFSLFEAADRALYRAKAAGRNQAQPLTMAHPSTWTVTTPGA